MSGFPQNIEIDAEGEVWAVAFTANGEYVVSGGDAGVQVWRVKDGEPAARMKVGSVWSVATSKDSGRFIAAGSYMGNVRIWDATTYEQVFAENISIWPIYDVDFSPDSTRLVSANGDCGTATIWDITGRKAVQKLIGDGERPGRRVLAAKYSPRGDRIATATRESIRVWDCDGGRLLLDINTLELLPWHAFLWFGNDQIFAVTRDSKIRQIDASLGSMISEWSVPDLDASIALPRHGQFIAYANKNGTTFWDTSTHTQVGFTPRSCIKFALAFSPNDRFLAFATRENKFIMKFLSFVKEPEIRIEDAALDMWRHGQLTNAEALLTAAILASKNNTTHHDLASRALVRARLRQWDAALVDAEESIKIQPSIIGYIANFVALVCKGDIDAGCRMCDIASLHFRSNHALFLLVKAVGLFMIGQHHDAFLRINDLVNAVDFNSTLYVIRAYMHFSLGNLYVEGGDYGRAIQSFEHARDELSGYKARPPLIISLISGWKFDDLGIIIQLRLCEALLSVGSTKAAGDSVLCIMEQDVNMTESIKTWVSALMQQCFSTAEEDNPGSVVHGHNDVSHPMTPLLREWSKLRLTTGSWKDVLAATTDFVLPRFAVYHVVCECLQTMGHVSDAAACLHQMCGELGREMSVVQANWSRDFECQCRIRLEDIGDGCADGQQYDEAISHYTVALSLNPNSPKDLLGKRSKAHANKGEWEYALKDANEVIKLDPSSPVGYETKRAALYGIGRYDDATCAFETMLSKMSESSDPEIRERSHRYIWPEKTKETIRATIKDIIRDSPLVLINTISGRLCDKSEQASSFENTPTFAELISSATTSIDDTRIEQKVEEYFRYAMFSHKWEDNEPLFEKVIQIAVYDLETSPTHEKLQMFCKIVREVGFNWAWSDTCCINKGDHSVLQEALVSMFRWYERAAMTIIFLRGVGRLAKFGALTRSIWNMRAWTLQEYHASQVVRIYTEDWTPYLGLKIYNYKESPEIISEMEKATGISAQALVALHPGLDNIREKLCLASTRQTTRVEDAAYSLLGIFTLSLPITYGEGDHALGRLLAQLLTSSGDVSILAWTGKSNSFNSCLPFSITAFGQLPTLHLPPAIPDDEMGTVTAGLRSLNFTLLTKLYERVNELPVPSFSGRRMKLPCLSFKLGQVSLSWNGAERVFRAQTSALGIVEIHSQEDLSRLSSLCLVHPWIDTLLDRLPVGGAYTLPEESADDRLSILDESPPLLSRSPRASTTRQTRTARLMSRIGRPFSSHPVLDVASLQPPSTLSPAEKRTRVLEFIARLGQPFGALLLTARRQNMDEYRRVATESLIKVRVLEFTPVVLEKLMQSVRILDVL